MGVAVDGFLISWRERPANFGWMTHHEAARRDDSALGNERAGGDDAAGTDLRAVKNDRTHADEAAVLDGAAVKGDGVADGDVIAEDEWVGIAHDVEDAAVLDVGTRADADEVDVTANDRAGPNAGVGADGDVADDDRGLVDVGRGVDLRRAAAMGANQIAPSR